MLSNLYFVLAAGVNAALVTQYVHVTQYVYEDVHVFVDAQGNPVSTSVQMIATTLPVSEALTTSTISLASAAATTEVTSGQELNAGAYQFIGTSSEAAVTTPSQASSEAAATTTSQAAATTTSADRTTSEEPSSTTSSTSSTASTSSATGTGETYSGEATYYDVGLGACGITNTDADFICALNVDQFNSFGAMSNGNPVCNKKILVTRGDKTVTVTVTDKCPGCSYGDLDLSPAAFNEIATEAEGRVDITWQWIS